MRALRSRWLDTLLVALAAVVIVSSLAEDIEHVRYGGAIMALALLVLLGRDRRPPLPSLLSFALLPVGAHVSPQITGPMFVSILICFGVAGTLRGRAAALSAWGFGCAAMVAAMVGNPFVQGAGDIGLTLTFCTLIWAAGLFATERGRAARAAHARAELIEAGRDLDVAEATAHERDRIAGELHDIVSHGLSIVILQTVAARMALADGGADEPGVDRRLDAVESTARDALDDMRRLLDLLRLTDEDLPAASTAPSPGLGQLAALLGQVREAGLAVQADVDGDGPDIPFGLDAAAYRILQEALTNVLKHAPGARTSVRVRRNDHSLEVSVENAAGRPDPAPPRGAGYGLIGMRQRAALYGGRFEAGPTGDGYRVSAVFPVGRPA